MPLSHTDAALVRGWLQGLPLPVLTEAYLPDFEGDGACHLRALLDELALKARPAGPGGPNGRAGSNSARPTSRSSAGRSRLSSA